MSGVEELNTDYLPRATAGFLPIERAAQACVDQLSARQRASESGKSPKNGKKSLAKSQTNLQVKGIPQNSFKFD